MTVDTDAQMILGPAGGIATTPVIVWTLEALAIPDRHDEAAVAAAGGWRDVDYLREGMAGLVPRLAGFGLRIDRRKAGLRIAKVRAPKAVEEPKLCGRVLPPHELSNAIE